MLARCPPSSSTLSPTRQPARDLSLDGSSEEKVDHLVATAHVNSNGEWRVFGNCFLRYGLGTLRRRRPTIRYSIHGRSKKRKYESRPIIDHSFLLWLPIHDVLPSLRPCAPPASEPSQSVLAVWPATPSISIFFVAKPSHARRTRQTLAD